MISWLKELYRILTELYRIHECRVRMSMENREWFSVKKGLKQESVLSTISFNLVMELMLREVREEARGNVNMFANGIL